MLGLVFTEFMEMVEEKFSIDMLDELIEESHLASNGAYTSVGRYSVDELLTLVTNLSRKSGLPSDELVRAFGHHLMARFSIAYPGFFNTGDGVFEFLKSIENHIHIEVKKLYDQAQLPHVDARQIDAATMQIDYRSHRPLADLAQGLIEGAVDHFGESITVQRQSLKTGQGYHERFMLVKQC